MTADPAIAACERASAAAEQPFIPTMSLEQVAIAAAREALAPLRKLHRPTRSNEWHTSRGSRYCAECREGDDRPTPWPCATAKLIYPESELP